MYFKISWKKKWLHLEWDAFKNWILLKHWNKIAEVIARIRTGHIGLCVQLCGVIQIVFLPRSRLMLFQIGLHPAGASGLITNRMLRSLMGSHSLLPSSQPGFHACFFFFFFPFFPFFCCLLQIRVQPVTVLQICFSSEITFDFLSYCEILHLLKSHCEVAATNRRCVVSWSGQMV